MYSGDICCPRDKPSGHSRPRPISYVNIPATSITPQNYKMDYNLMPNFKDFTGPYKDYKPPGNRTPAVGERIWGDVPYLPSYLDPMYFPKEPSGAPPLGNLYFRGPFYKGVSETHSEFVNRGVPPGQKYHEYVRHYEEPGMKDEQSVTHADFQPPLPMLPRDKTPCLKEDPPKSWYKPEMKVPRNPHAKELEMRSQHTEVIYIDEEPVRDFSTEHNDEYVCYQKEKTGTKIKDPCLIPDEMFLKNLHDTHQECQHPPPSENPCDGSCRVRHHCPGPTPKTISWLMHPRNYSFKNGVMLIPCKCRNAESPES